MEDYYSLEFKNRLKSDIRYRVKSKTAILNMLHGKLMVFLFENFNKTKYDYFFTVQKISKVLNWPVHMIAPAVKKLEEEGIIERHSYQCGDIVDYHDLLIVKKQDNKWYPYQGYYGLKNTFMKKGSGLNFNRHAFKKWETKFITKLKPISFDEKAYTLNSSHPIYVKYLKELEKPKEEIQQIIEKPKCKICGIEFEKKTINGKIKLFHKQYLCRREVIKQIHNS